MLVGLKFTQFSGSVSVCTRLDKIKIENIWKGTNTYSVNEGMGDVGENIVWPNRTGHIGHWLIPKTCTLLQIKRGCR